MTSPSRSEGTMLNITRSAGQSITIAGYITLHIKELSNGHVMIGIDAPRDVPVYRTEKAFEREPLVSISMTTPLGRFVRRKSA